jgi:hypothetical protein
MRAPFISNPRICYDGAVDSRSSWVLVLGLANCTRAQPVSQPQWHPSAAPDLGTVVARVGGVPIFARQVLAEAKRSGTPAREALASMIDANVLAEGVRSRGWIPATSDDFEVESALVQRFVERDLEASFEPSAMPDKDLRPLYDRLLDRYVHPRLVELGILAIYTGPLMKDERWTARKHTAQDLAAYLAKHPPKTLDDFAAIAKEREWSDRAVVYNRTIQGPDRPFPKVVGTEALKLRAPGQTTPLVWDETGFYIARYIDEKAPENVSYEQARGELATAYFEKWTQEQFSAFTSKLAQAHKLEVHFDRIVPDEKER